MKKGLLFPGALDAHSCAALLDPGSHPLDGRSRRSDLLPSPVPLAASGRSGPFGARPPPGLPGGRTNVGLLAESLALSFRSWTLTAPRFLASPPTPSACANRFGGLG